MRVNIWNALDEYTVCMFAGWNRAGSGIKVYHCAFGRHECAVHCGHPEDPAHSKDPLIFFFWKSGLRCISFPWPSPIFFLMFLSCVLMFSRTQANVHPNFLSSHCFWPNSSISYASYVLFMLNVLVQTIPLQCSYKFTISRIPLLLHSLLRAQPLSETWAWRQCCILTSRVRQPKRESASNQAHYETLKSS